MRKYLVMMMAMVLSAAMFAGGMKEGKMNNGREMKERAGFMVFNIASKEDFIKAGVTEENYNKANTAIKNGRLQLEKNEIAIKQKELEVRKLMLEENKNWTEIEKNLNEAAKIKVDTQLKQMKLRDEIKKYVTDDQIKAIANSCREKRPAFQKKEGMRDGKGEMMMNNQDRKDKMGREEGYRGQDKR